MITKHLLLLNRLSNAMNMQFHLSQKERLTTIIVTLQLLGLPWQKYLAAIVKLDNSYKWPQASPQTEVIAGLEKERDRLLTWLYHVVNDHLNLSPKPNTKPAAKAISFILNNYKGWHKANYEEETAMVTNLLEELDKPENAAHIVALGIGEIISLIRQNNVDFQALYETRYDIQQVHRVDGNTKEARHDADTAFNELCLAIVALRSMLTAQADIDKLDALILSINGTIEQYTIVYHRHVGILKHKKDDDKKDDDKKDDGSQTPGTPDTPTPGTPPDNPNTPDTPTPGTPQNPDTNLPSAPDTPNQNPSGGPQPLDPNEHPSMGEH